MKQKKSICAMFVAVLLGCMLTGCGHKFDATGYTKAILALQFQGETDEALQYVDGAKPSELQQQYIGFIQTMTSNFTEGMTLSDSRTEDFENLVAQMFSTMQYTVGEAKETDDKEYEVPVTIRSSDVMVLFQQYLTSDSLVISQKVENGEYKGTEDEIKAKINQEMGYNAYELFQKAIENSKYGDKETVILKVSGNKDAIYSVNQEDMTSLITKILRLDEIQG